MVDLSDEAYECFQDVNYWKRLIRMEQAEMKNCLGDMERLVHRRKIAKYEKIISELQRRSNL